MTFPIIPRSEHPEGFCPTFLEFQKWFLNAKPGEATTYFVGDLANSRSARPGPAIKGGRFRDNLNDVADYASELSSSRQVHLLQRRVREGFEYLAVKADPRRIRPSGEKPQLHPRVKVWDGRRLISNDGWSQRVFA